MSDLHQELHEYLPDELLEATPAEIDWAELANQIGKVARWYNLPTTPEGEEGPWLDKLELMQDVARHVRDGGEIDVDAVLIGQEIPA